MPQPDYSFQDDAVNTTASAFASKNDGRYLAVIPTGGGKTRCAVRIVNKLFDEGVLNPGSDKVLWVAHRIELINQAKKKLSVNIANMNRIKYPMQDSWSLRV